MKAFLSHSSQDREFVRAVAKELGRTLCVYDEQAFETGDEFKKAIEEHLDEASIFVLFASEKALESCWVKFEIDEAWYGKFLGQMGKALVYIIDSSVTVDGIPKWLQRALIRSENAPVAIARDIKMHLTQALLKRQQKYFVGRSKEREELEEMLTPTDGAFPPHVIFVTGLPGIGRRALVKDVAPKLLNLSKFVEVRVQDGDSINDICLKVADHIEPYSTDAGFQRIAKEIQSLPGDAALQRTMKNLRKLTQSGDLPIFYDDKGVINSEGQICEAMQSIIGQIAPTDDAYSVIVSKRRPKLALNAMLPILKIGELSIVEIKRLTSKLLRDSKINISAGDIAQLGEYIAGYPPAAYFASQQTKIYGIKVVLHDKSNLIKFRTGVFLKHLAETDLKENEKSILQLLAMNSPLPLQIIAAVTGIKETELHPTIINLVDLCLIVTTSDGYYRIAEPIAEAASNAFGYPSQEHNRTLVKALRELLKQADFECPRLELSRVFFRVAYLVGDKAAKKQAFHIASDLIDLTEKLYHTRKYRECIKCAYTAIRERPKNTLAREFLIKALCQEEKWPVAEREIVEFSKYAPERDTSFLRGFYCRRKGDIDGAMSEYKEAERFGRRGVAIKRELAHCYFVSGDYDEASRYIHQTIKALGDNPYLVDLWVKIEKRRGDEDSVDKALARLKAVDKPNFYQHRLSTVKLAFNHLEDARKAAKKAVAFENPPFAHIYQLIRCEIVLKNFPEAKNLLGRLERDFGGTRHDLRKSLWCRYEIARGRFKKALDLTERFSAKDTPIYNFARRDAIQGELNNSALPDDRREKYQSELISLNLTIGSSKTKEYTAIDVD